MKKHKTKILLASFVILILIVAGVLYFSVINIEEIHAGIAGGGPACIVTGDCNPDYWYPQGQGICGYGYGYYSCDYVDQCSNCGASVMGITAIQRRCYNNEICQVSYDNGFGFGQWYNCYQCYDGGSSQLPGTPPGGCHITDYDYNHALYFKDSNDNTIFAFTDAGQIMTTYGFMGLWAELGDNISFWFLGAQQNGNTFPIYNQAGNLIAFIGDSIGVYQLFLKGSLHQYQNEILTPPPSGNFIIENSFGDVVSYIDNNGNLYMVGCVSEDQHFQ